MRTMKLFFGLFLVTILLLCVNSQDEDGETGSTTEADPSGSAPRPDQVSSEDKTNGLMGAIETYMWPFTSLILQFINSFLIHTMGKQLPCTVSSLMPLKVNCANTTSDQKDAS